MKIIADNCAEVEQHFNDLPLSVKYYLYGRILEKILKDAFKKKSNYYQYQLVFKSPVTIVASVIYI